MPDAYRPVPYRPERLPLDEMRSRAQAFHDRMAARRSVRFFSDEPVPQDLVASAIRTASTAPSGAHRQPWTFVAVQDPDLKRRIRVAAEEEEHRSYEGGRMPEEWLEALAPLGTDWRKPYLETAPWIVVLFAQRHGLCTDGERRTHYYVRESCGIAAGFFIAALHEMGLATLTHTPSPMTFLSEVLERPRHEQPYILFPVGYPAADATVPDLRRKALDEVVVWR
ncbi:MAG: nitroreductase family protein [Alphaproteobacteria bacterium]|nr:nitroreductase family protein [Alphaproteobacteria bacterium]